MNITSKTDVCNLALDLLSAGVVRDVDNPSNPTEELISRWYEQVRRKVLREHSWNFALKRAALAASSTSPAFGYDSQYPLPADFLRLLYIQGENGGPLDYNLYQLEGGSILTSIGTSSSGTVNIVYVSDFQTVSRFDPLFIQLLAHELALAVSYKVTESNTNVQRIAEIRRGLAALAKAVDGQERPPIRVERSRNKWLRGIGS